MITVYQINLQEQFGGGEVYTRFFSQALIELGYRVVLFVSRRAGFWDDLLPGGVQLVRISGVSEFLRALPREKAVVFTQTALDPVTAREVAASHVLCGFCHMPLYQRNPPGFEQYRLLIAVSQHVLDSIKSRGYDRVYATPLYGVADLRRPGAGAAIISRSEYDWDRRKLRDRLLGLIEPLWRALVPAIEFRLKPGLTLGIVSRLTPIKQFPQMLSLLAPVLARHPGVHLEIFGSGGFASVRDMKRAIAPVRAQVRFWGQQGDVAAIYARLDYVLSGLPEKEALGLNLIEAQSCGTPVLAVHAPPFTETVVDGESGWLFQDPRLDGGRAFEALIVRLAAGAARPDPRKCAAHLGRFSREAFRGRVAAVLAALAPVG